MKEVKELIEVIDEYGNPTGEILPREEIHNANLLHNEVACFVVNHKGEILLEKRSPNKRYSPNKYGLCAGHVIAHESLEEALVREIKEEIGITINPDDLTSFGTKEYFRDTTNSHITYFYYLFLDLEESDFTIQKEELTEVKWFNIDYLIELINNNDTSTVITKDRLYLLEYLKSIV